MAVRPATPRSSDRLDGEGVAWTRAYAVSHSQCALCRFLIRVGDPIYLERVLAPEVLGCPRQLHAACWRKFAAHTHGRPHPYGRQTRK